MGLRNLVDQQLRKAFILARDLAIEATLVKKTAIGFNFGTSDITTTNDGSVITKVIVTKTVKKNNVTSKTIMLKSSEVGSIGEYSKIILEDDQYSFGVPSHDRGYILVVTVFKEG